MHLNNSAPEAATFFNKIPAIFLYKSLTAVYKATDAYPVKVIASSGGRGSQKNTKQSYLIR